MRLTPEERVAVEDLKRLSRRWPKTLWLFSANGALHVMQKKDGKRVVLPCGGVDQDAIVETIAIENDGGDW